MERDHNGNKASKLLLLCNPYHRLSAVKDIVSFSLVFFLFLKRFIVKRLTVKYTFLLTQSAEQAQILKMIGQL